MAFIIPIERRSRKVVKFHSNRDRGFIHCGGIISVAGGFISRFINLLFRNLIDQFYLVIVNITYCIVGIFHVY